MIDAAPQESCGPDLYGREGKKGIREGWKEGKVKSLKEREAISEEHCLFRLSLLVASQVILCGSLLRSL